MKNLRHILSESMLLLEYDREKTIKRQDPIKGIKSSIDWSGDQNFATHPVEKKALEQYHAGDHDGARNTLMQHFEDADPSPQKKHVQNIARIYNNNGVSSFEDIASRLGPALATHHELSNRKIIPQEHRDAGKFKTIHEVEDVVDLHKHKLSKNQEDKDYSRQMHSPMHATVTEHDDFTHIIPHTEEAAKFHGRGTRWCTSAEKNSMFSHYNKDARLHIYNPKNPTYPGEKYQAHHVAIDYGNDDSKLPDSPDDSQIMDEKDRHVDLRHLAGSQNGIANHIMMRFKDMHTDAKSADSAMESKDSIVQRHYIKNAKTIAPEHVDKFYKKGNFAHNQPLFKHMRVGDDRPYHETKSVFDDYTSRVNQRDDDFDTQLHISDLGEYAMVHGSNEIFNPMNHPQSIKALGEFLKPHAEAARNGKKIDSYLPVLAANNAASRHLTDDHVKDMIAIGNTSRGRQAMSMANRLSNNQWVNHKKHYDGISALAGGEPRVLMQMDNHIQAKEAKKSQSGIKSQIKWHTKPK